MYMCTTVQLLILCIMEKFGIEYHPQLVVLAKGNALVILANIVLVASAEPDVIILIAHIWLLFKFYDLLTLDDVILQTISIY